MLGAIAGDVIGSVFEHRNTKSTEFDLFCKHSRFTDDTVLTVAVADAILNQNDYATSLKDFGRKYPNAGYGGTFISWIFENETRPYNSWGNGSAMRVSPIGFAFDNEKEVMQEAQLSARVSHNHPEGIKGAQATALAIYLARTGSSKSQIRHRISQQFNYNLERSIEEIRPGYEFDVSCQGSVPESIIAFLDSNDFEDAIRKAISIGGDSDTIASIAGGISQAFYGQIPDRIEKQVKKLLPGEFLDIIHAFEAKFMTR